jgi:hypothetical protein
LDTVNILIRKCLCKVELRKTLLVPNKSTPLQTTLAAHVLLADEHFLLEERYLAKKNLWSVEQELEDQHFPKKDNLEPT